MAPKLFIAATLFALAATARPDDQQWESQIDEHGLRSAQVAGVAKVGAYETGAVLRFVCRPGKLGTLSFSMEVARSDAVKGFDFGDFEGPDALANDKRLSDLSIDGGLLHPQVRVAQTGYYGAQAPSSFVFESSAPANAAGELALLADSIGPGTTGLRWTVTGATDAAQTLTAEFPGAGAARAMAEAKVGCGPAPELRAETVAAWEGKDPNAIGLFDHPGVLWRMKALLGRDFNAYRLALADAQPVARDGEIVYVLGHMRGEPKMAAAWLIDRKSLASEAVMIDQGALRHIRDEDEARLATPEAVREYLSSVL